MEKDVFWPSAKYLAEMFGVSVETARRWRRRSICPPRSVVMVLSRDLGIFAAEWRGWTIQGPSLYSPEGWGVTRNDALSVPLMRQQLAVYQAEIRKLREPDVQDQPAPDEWNYEQIMAG